MRTNATSILDRLRAVQVERERRLSVPGLLAKVVALKEFQQRRFSHTYADLLRTERYGAAARFFLDELYGPSDFTQRDEQFARVVPALVRLFPVEIVETVAALADLHALSEGLDSEMALQLSADLVTPLDYIDAWQRTGREMDRFAQIDLTLRIAAQLDRLTRKALMRKSLRLMRGPARAAGLAELQLFLEAGFDTFRAMNGAQDFMDTVRSRERALASSLFEARYCGGSLNTSVARALSLLP